MIRVCLATIVALAAPLGVAWLVLGRPPIGDPPAVAAAPTAVVTAPVNLGAAAGEIVTVGLSGSYSLRPPGGGGALAPSNFPTQTALGDVFGSPWGITKTTGNITRPSTVPTNKWWTSFYWGVDAGSYQDSTRIATMPQQYPVPLPLQVRTDHLGGPAPGAGAYDGFGLSYNVVPSAPTLNAPVVQSQSGGLSYQYQINNNIYVGVSHVTATSVLDPSPIDNLTVADVRLHDFSAGTVTADIRHGAIRGTFGRGLPFAYFVKGSDGGNYNWKIHLARSWGGPGTPFPDNPTLITDPRASGAALLTIDKNTWAFFGPPGTVWTDNQNDGLNLQATGSGSHNYLAVTVLPDGLSDRNALIDAFLDYSRHAYAYPTGTDLSWRYDEATATVTTFFTTTTALQAGAPISAVNTPLIGLAPHQWKNTTATPTSYRYAQTPVGTLKVIRGNTFSTTLPFQGILPALPEVYDAATEAQVRQLLIAATTGSADPWRGTRPTDDGTGYTLDRQNYIGYSNGDTYGLGQGLQMIAQMILVAEKSGDHETVAKLTAQLRQTLTTYLSAETTPGSGTTKANRYFAYDPTWGTLLGYPSSFGASSILNDHHFHYGYWITAAAILALHDPDFVREYGGMIDLLIKDAANWDRGDTRFPFLRYFDPYAGHSWASGPQYGQNQESISEAIDFANGVTLWGSVTGNRTIRDLGIWLYTHETLAGWQYWNNIDGDNWPTTGYTTANAPTPVNFAATVPEVAQVQDTGANYGTFFGYNPAFIFGITKLPFNGGALWLGRFPDHVRRTVAFWQQQIASASPNPPGPGGSGPYDCVGGPAAAPNCGVWWTDLVWLYEALIDPERARADYEAGQGTYYGPAAGGINYPAFRTPGESRVHTFDWIASFQALGPITTSVSANAPHYAVFTRHPTDAGTLACAGANLSDRDQTIRFSTGAKLTAEPGLLGLVGCRAPGEAQVVAGIDPETIVKRVRPTTPPGGPVTVTLPFETFSSPARVTLQGDRLQGSLQAEVTDATPRAGWPAGVLSLPTRYRLDTTGVTFTAARVCLPYSATEADRVAGRRADGLRLYHHDGAAWRDVTASLDTTNRVICGDVASFSPFVIGVPGSLYLPLSLRGSTIRNFVQGHILDGFSRFGQ